jgi:hypothetical protein
LIMFCKMENAFRAWRAEQRGVCGVHTSGSDIFEEMRHGRVIDKSVSDHLCKLQCLLFLSVLKKKREKIEGECCGFVFRYFVAVALVTMGNLE